MKRNILCGLLAAVMLLSCGCAAPAPAEKDGKLQVVCSLFPYYDFARAIGGEYVDAKLLVPAGRETHSFEPTPLDAITMSQADILVYNGGHGEYWVEEMLGAAGEEIHQVVRMMDYVDAVEGETVEGMEETAHAHPHSHLGPHDEHEYDEHDPHEHHEHEQEDTNEDGHAEEIHYDEHIWTSPVNCKKLARAICDALITADPAHADAFEANLADYLLQLDALDAAFRQVVAEGSRNMVVFGDRFPMLYFCKTYGLHYRAAFHGCAGDTEPSLHTLKYLIDKVNNEQIPVVYTIELSSQKIADVIAESTGAKVRMLHSCQTVSREEFDAGETYLSLMWKNVDALKEGLA